MKAAFCMECPEPTVIAAGDLPETILRGSANDKETATPAPIPSHIVKGHLHSKVKVIEVGDAPRHLGESSQGYLDRLQKEHAHKLR